MSKSVRILTMIEERGGMRFRRIQEELWRMSHPEKPFTRAERGYWCTALQHLLPKFCAKKGRKWVRDPSIPLSDKPWREIRWGWRNL